MPALPRLSQDTPETSLRPLPLTSPPLGPLPPLLPAQYKPTHVMNCAGLTGRPNVDWCETHKVSLRWAHPHSTAPKARTRPRMRPAVDMAVLLLRAASWLCCLRSHSRAR